MNLNELFNMEARGWYLVSSLLIFSQRDMKGSGTMSQKVGFFASPISNCNQKSIWQVFSAVALGRIMVSVP